MTNALAAPPAGGIRLTRVAELFGTLNLFEEATSQMPAEIPGMADEELEQTLVYARAMEKAGFVIRGAAAAEIVKRESSRQVGGRGKKDEDGTGKMKTIARVAAANGISASALEKDIRVHERFGETLAVDADPMPREYYVEALSAGDRAQEVIEIAQQKRNDPGYTLEKFKRDMRELVGGKTPDTVEDTQWVNIGLDTASRERLKALARDWEVDYSGVVKRLLHEYQPKAEPPIVVDVPSRGPLQKKVCSKCKRPKPATTEYYHAQKSRADGLHPQCKVCRAEDKAAKKGATEED